jgi:hypothetical protein
MLPHRLKEPFVGFWRGVCWKLKLNIDVYGQSFIAGETFDSLIRSLGFIQPPLLRCYLLKSMFLVLHRRACPRQDTDEKDLSRHF